MAFPINPIYKLLKDPIDNSIMTVRKFCGGNLYADIPFDEANTDYQEYLEWVAEGNKAEAAD